MDSVKFGISFNNQLMTILINTN